VHLNIQRRRENVTRVAVACPGTKITMILTNETEPNHSSELRTDVGRFPWFALQVRARCEAGVAKCLEANGYEWFLPMYKCRKRWSDRIKQVDIPLFPGYLFCRFDPQYRLPIVKTSGVIRIVGCNRSPIPVDEVEITAVQTLVASGVRHQPWPFLTVGHRVRIESGPLLGLQGI